MALDRHHLGGLGSIALPLPRRGDSEIGAVSSMSGFVTGNVTGSVSAGVPRPFLPLLRTCGATRTMETVFMTGNILACFAAMEMSGKLFSFSFSLHCGRLSAMCMWCVGLLVFMSSTLHDPVSCINLRSTLVRCTVLAGQLRTCTVASGSINEFWS